VAPPLLVVTEGGPVWRQASNVLLQVWKPSCLVIGDPVLRRWVSGSPKAHLELVSIQSVSAYMTPLRTWSTVQVAGLLLTELPHLEDLTNEMPSGDLVVCKQLNTAFSCAFGQGKSPSYMTCHITGAHITGY